MTFRAPLLGYNTNVRHKGKLFHIQTEDSGINHPHVMTHLFADGGRIIASRKTSYAEHVGTTDNLNEVVKKLMQQQHKAMFIALRDGVYDEDAPASPEASAQAAANQHAHSAALEQTQPNPVVTSSAAAAIAAPARAPSKPPRKQLYDEPRAAHAEPAKNASPSRPPVSIFGSDLMSEKSLDEVILSYLASDDGEGAEK